MKKALPALGLLFLLLPAPDAKAADELCEPPRLISALEDLYKSDQQSRRGLAPINDVWNRDRLQQIVEECGWPAAEVVGRKAAMGAFLVLQHAPLDFQLRYVSLIRTAGQEGQLVPGTLPYLEDRILVRQGLPQKYGTQFSNECDLHEIEDPETVEERREAVGLNPLQEYVTHCIDRTSSP